VKFDGVQELGARRLLCFTITDLLPCRDDGCGCATAPSFALAEKDITTVGLMREVARLRRRFGPITGTAKPVAQFPYEQRAPRALEIPTNHYQ